jgi:hypothetical protein
MYATLANCFFHLGNKNNGDEYEKKFIGENPLQWEKETYFNHKPT